MNTASVAIGKWISRRVFIETIQPVRASHVYPNVISVRKARSQHSATNVKYIRIKWSDLTRPVNRFRRCFYAVNYGGRQLSSSMANGLGTGKRSQWRKSVRFVLIIRLHGVHVKRKLESPGPLPNPLLIDDKTMRKVAKHSHFPITASSLPYFLPSLPKSRTFLRASGKTHSDEEEIFVEEKLSAKTYDFHPPTKA